MKNICISLLILGLTQAAIAVDDIPASVTSVEAEDLESSGTTDVKDLAAVTPDAVEKASKTNLHGTSRWTEALLPPPTPM